MDDKTYHEAISLLTSIEKALLKTLNNVKNSQA